MDAQSWLSATLVLSVSTPELSQPLPPSSGAVGGPLDDADAVTVSLERHLSVPKSLCALVRTFPGEGHRPGSPWSSGVSPPPCPYSCCTASSGELQLPGAPLKRLGSDPETGVRSWGGGGAESYPGKAGQSLSKKMLWRYRQCHPESPLPAGSQGPLGRVNSAARLCARAMQGPGDGKTQVTEENDS